MLPIARSRDVANFSLLPARTIRSLEPVALLLQEHRTRRLPSKRTYL
jgi:hypothetical protein